MSEMNLRSSEIIGEKDKKLSPENNEFTPIIDKVSESVTLASPQVSFKNGPIVNLKLEDIGVLGLNSTRLPKSTLNSNVSNRVADEALFENFDFGFAEQFHASAVVDLPISNTLENFNSKENYVSIADDKPLLNKRKKIT